MRQRWSDRVSSSSYGQALQVAIEAAQAAGTVLRREFYRSGGPRGGDGHAPVDLEVEALIRARLGSAFPDYGLRGEELTAQDRLPGDPDRHLWLVDPNDGTRAFLRGWRGAAISIGLLRAGQPVLGVVYAYCAPQSGEDLIAWGQGGGPVTRNGREIRRQWPLDLDGSVTVLVSQAADAHSLENAEAVAPARFWAVPSVAYRLALVAAGEGDATGFPRNPYDWDYAAGHALLRGSDGELFNGSAQPITYPSTGEISRCIGCFGGSSATVSTLVQRRWAPVLGPPTSPTTDPYPLVLPRAGQAIEDQGLLSRAQGCLLGQLAGDSLGRLVEFMDERAIADRYPLGVRRLVDGGTWGILAGQPTDDSELALLLARALVKAQGFDPYAIAQAYAYWYRSQPFDMGQATRRALAAIDQALGQQADPLQAANHHADPDSQANGALMRISPLALFGHGVSDQVLGHWARTDARLTHPHPICQDANAAFVIALRQALITGASPLEIYTYTLGWARSVGLHGDVVRSLELARTQKPQDYYRHMGWVQIALQNAFFQLIHAPSLEEGVIHTVMQGGDTDTNAAITGALLGAIYGYAGIPQQWRDRILTCRPIQGLPGVLRPRPRAMWPVDSLRLAERLLVIGQQGRG